MTTYRLVIPKTLPNLNDYTDEVKKSRKGGNRMKQEVQAYIKLCARQQLKGLRFHKPVAFLYLWVEKDRRRDKDNVAFAKKFIQDALVSLGILENDGWKQIAGFTDVFDCDPANPRVEVLMWEVEDGQAYSLPPYVFVQR